MSAPETIDPTRALLCVPTSEEHERLARAAPASVDPGRWLAVEIIGFGPVAAAARTAVLCERHRPERVVLAGIAGGRADGPAIGTASWFGDVALDGVGAGEGPGLALPSAMGFAQWGDVTEHLSLADDGPSLLTVCAAADGATMLATRRARFPDAVAEDMEAFGVALAAHLAGVPAHVVRGISNAAGDRRHAVWRIDDALDAVAALLDERMGGEA
ncbi:MAG: futalosine hydrolase [Planctomycetota bacterium]